MSRYVVVRVRDDGPGATSYVQFDEAESPRFGLVFRDPVTPEQRHRIYTDLAAALNRAAENREGR